MALETIWQDVRYAFRGLLRNSGFSAAAILSLMLGIGASLAIFTVTDNLLLRPLPYRDAGGLVMVWERNTRLAGEDHNVVSPGNYLDWKRQNDVFESMAGFRAGSSVLSAGSRSEQLEKQLVTADVFPLLGVQPVRGRLFTAEDDTPGVNSALIISYRLWQSWFGGDEGVIGRKVQVNSTPRIIIGVMPPGFYLLERETDLWDTLGLDNRDYRKAQGRWMRCLARLKPGVTRDVAQSHMAALAQRLETAYPVFDKNWSVNVEPLRDSMVRQVRTSLLILLGAVGLLLAVACANVANLLLARYAARRRELAVRMSVGAGRFRVIRQLLTESVLLGLLGGAAGVLAAKWAVQWLVALAPRKPLTRNADLLRSAYTLLRDRRFGVHRNPVWDRSSAGRLARTVGGWPARVRALECRRNESAASVAGRRRGCAFGHATRGRYVAVSQLRRVADRQSRTRPLRSADLPRIASCCALSGSFAQPVLLAGDRADGTASRRARRECCQLPSVQW